MAQHGPARAVDRVRRFFRELGPGLITGAADDDPSGISTYSVAGAAFGLATLWTALFSFPLMAAVQLICARIGLVSGRGLAGVLREFYSRRLLWAVCTLLVLANTFNVAADLAGMADAMELVTGASSLWFHPLFAMLILALLVGGSYRTTARVLKALTLVLLAYVTAALLARPSWEGVLRATLVPRLSLDHDYLLTLVAIFGTTISPYLFFWQAAQEVEEEKALGRRTIAERLGATMKELAAARRDVVTGMFFSNLIAFFIILTTAATLYPAGHRDIETARDAAEALRPLAGDAASLLFALGLVGTGLLGVPVLAGSAAFAISEAARWRAGLDERLAEARPFYSVILIAMLVGMALDVAGANAIAMLFAAAVLNGILAPPLIVVVLLIGNDRRVMGNHANSVLLNLLGVAAALVMTVAAIAALIA